MEVGQQWDISAKLKGSPEKEKHSSRENIGVLYFYNSIPQEQ